MREILFRGKRVDNGEWVYGTYAAPPRERPNKEPAFIISLKWDENFCVLLDTLSFGKKAYLGLRKYMYEVTPESVGQYTGTEADGVKIFEGDIILLDQNLDYSTDDKEIFKPLIVNYDDEFSNYELLRPLDTSSESEEEWIYALVPACVGDAERVIGNIHDNPELIRQTENNES